MDAQLTKAQTTVERINATGRFNYIVLTLEDVISPRRQNRPTVHSESAKKFLTRWGQFLDETEPEVLAGITNPYAFIGSNYGGNDFRNKKIATEALLQTLGFISSGTDVYMYLEGAFVECGRDAEKFRELISEIETRIKDLTLEEFKVRAEGNKAESLVYWTSKSRISQPITRAVVEKLLDLDDEDFMRINFATLYSGLSGLDMQNPKHRATHKNDLDELSISVASRTISILAQVPAEKLFEDKYFQVVRQLFTIPTHEAIEKWAFDEIAGMELINRLVDFAVNLGEDERQALDPENKKTYFLTKYSVDERLPRFTSTNHMVLLNGPEQTPENAHRLAEELLRDSTDLAKPLKCGTPELRLLIKFGYRDTASAILRNYAERPASDFTFNCARFFDEIRNDTATTLAEAEELAKIPHLVDEDTQRILEQKFIDAMLEQPSLCDYPYLNQVLSLASETRPKFTNEVIIPRLYEEVFGEPISRTDLNTQISDPNTIGFLGELRTQL